MVDENNRQQRLSTSLKRRRLLSALGSGGAIALAGCSGRSGGGGGGGGGGNGTGSGSGGPNNLQFLTMGVGDNIESYFKKNNKKFEEQTGTEVDFTSITWSNAESTLTTRVQGGKAPDVSRLASRWIPKFVKMGSLEPIGDLMSGEFEKKFYPKVAATTNYQDKYYGVPWAYSNKCLFYNKDVFKEAGLDPENPPLNSWDEMLSAAKQIKKNTDTPAYGLPAANRLTTVSQWLHYHWSFGADIINDKGEPAVATPEAIEALKFYSNLANKHKVTQSSPLSSTRHDVRNLFEQGNVGMHIGHVYVAINIKENNSKTNYGIVQVPQGPGGRYSLATTDSLVVYSDSKVKDKAKELIKFYFKPERRFQYCKQKGFLPTMKEVGQRNYFSESPIWSPFLKASQYARARPRIVNWSEANKRLVKAIQQTVAGRRTAKEALESAQSDLKDIIKQPVSNG